MHIQVFRGHITSRWCRGSCGTSPHLRIHEPSPRWHRCLFRHDWVVYAKPRLRRTGTCAALSQRLHPPRRHLQPQTGRPGGQGNVTFRWRDSAHANKQRLLTAVRLMSVLAPLSAAPAPARLRAHPQLRLPRQPETRCTAATVLPSARQFERPLASNPIVRRRSSLFVHRLELPRLRRHRAHR